MDRIETLIIEADNAKRTNGQSMQAKPKRRDLPNPMLQVGWSTAIREWLLRQATHPKRISRWLGWWIKQPWRAASFARVMTKGMVDDGTYNDRMDVCEQCTLRYPFVRRNGQVSYHCGGCGCPAWSFSALDYANRLAAWKCPLHLHDGKYATDAMYDALCKLGYGDEMVDRLVIAQGCSTCSGGLFAALDEYKKTQPKSGCGCGS